MINDNYFYLDNFNGNFLLRTVENFSIESIEGPIGNTGNRGDIGPRGLQGLQGRRGIRGNQGMKGEPGVQGYRGIAGTIGNKGNKGEDGIQGPKGNQGFVGPKGNYGSRGPPGPLGPPGDSGTPGRQGYVGYKGKTGEKGDTGNKIPSFDEDIVVSNFGSRFMTGFGINMEVVQGEITNPIDKRFTASYKYEHNLNKHVICPPNHYLSGFGYGKKGPDQNEDSWCKGKNKECKVGFRSKGKGEINGLRYEKNRMRPGMPYAYAFDCARLK